MNISYLYDCEMHVKRIYDNNNGLAAANGGSITTTDFSNENMTLPPDDFCHLLARMNLSSSSSSSPNPSVDADARQERMTTVQRLEHLLGMRTSMQQRLILLLVKAGHADKTKREEIDSQIEECRDLLDGMEVLIARLRRRKNDVDGKECVFEEWREVDEG